MPHHHFKKWLLLAAIILPISGTVMMKAYAAEPVKETVKDGDKSAASNDSLKNHYVKIPALILPVMGDNGVEQIISLVVVLEATSKEAADNITEVVPRLNDAFLTELYGSLDRREHMKNGIMDVNFLKQRLTDIAIKIAGPDKVKTLLIQGITQHQA